MKGLVEGCLSVELHYDHANVNTHSINDLLNSMKADNSRTALVCASISRFTL